MLFQFCLFAIIIPLSVYAESLPFHIKNLEDLADFHNIMNIVRKPRKLEKPGGITFSWGQCGNSADLAVLDKLQVGPDPIKLPGNLSLSFVARVFETLKAPIKLEVELKKKIVFWIPIPCIDNIGSCTYDDVCQLVTKIPCPPEFKKYGIPCVCPVSAGNFSLPQSNFYVNPQGLPSVLTDGYYFAQLRFSEGGREVTCFWFNFSLTAGQLRFTAG